MKKYSSEGSRESGDGSQNITIAFTTPAKGMIRVKFSNLLLGVIILSFQVGGIKS